MYPTISLFNPLCPFHNKKMKRKVVCVFGKFDDKSDFVIEPVCDDDCNCKSCKDAFWIEKVEEKEE